MDNWIDKLCPDLNKCQNQNCERQHPRRLTGVCIGYLKGICQQSEICGLIHFSERDLESELDKHSINGIYQFNLCYKKCNDQNCRYLHPPWLKQLCVDCKNKKCDKQKDGLWHIPKWGDIKEKVYELYNINKLNPENICNNIPCQCDAERYNLNKYCIKYFKGTCPYHRCQKLHKNWEELEYSGYFQNLQDQVIKPCIRLDQNTNQFVSQSQTLQCNFIMEKSKLQLMINEIQQRPQVDIIFILDCTKSMDIWIEASRKNIISIITEFKKKVLINTAIRMAAVCYKDFSDGPNHIQYHNFTIHPEEIEKFIKNIKPEGGDDIPEDLSGALEVAYKLNICKDPESLLQLFIITDAPCHGRKYHNLAYDTHPDNQDLEEKLLKFVKLKQRFFLSFLQIKDQTKIMEAAIQNVMKNNYQSAAIPDKQLKDYILFSLSSTYCKAQSMNTNKVFQHECYATFTKQKKMPYSYQNQSNQSYCDFIHQQIQKTCKQSQTLLFIENNELQVDQKGQQAEVFKGFDQKNNVQVVIKIPQWIFQKYNQETLNDDDRNQAYKLADSKYKQQLIAKQLSHHFNYCCGTVNNMKFIPLYYATPYLYELEKPFKGLKKIYAESYIDIEEPWKKYTNNSKQRDKEIDITSFSHFTFYYTNGQLMITDLQGKANVLSDPAIHSFDVRLPDQTNQESKGSSSFFQNQHPECSSICKQLGLEQIQRQQSQGSNQIDISDADTQIEEGFGNKINRENLYKICSNCNELEKLEEKSDCSELCVHCKEKEKNKQRTNCQCCNVIFYDSYSFNQVFETVVQYCQQCQNNQCHQIVEKKCYYCGKRICLQTIKEIIVKNQKIEICIDAHFFLKQVQCKNCHSNYNFNQLLSKEDYYQNNYNCGCKN